MLIYKYLQMLHRVLKIISNLGHFVQFVIECLFYRHKEVFKFEINKYLLFLSAIIFNVT